MHWVDKIWGKTKELVDSVDYSRHELDVVAGGYCSLHYHRLRSNHFNVISGLIEIIEFFGPFVVRTKLAAGDTYDVPSMVPHMFVVHRSGSLIEEYYSDRGGLVKSDDIVRLVVGGKLEVSRLGDLPECLFNKPVFLQILPGR